MLLDIPIWAFFQQFTDHRYFLKAIQVANEYHEKKVNKQINK